MLALAEWWLGTWKSGKYLWSAFYTEASALLLALNMPPKELRGMGIQVGKAGEEKMNA